MSTTAQAVRRLAVTKQHLAGRLPKKASKDDLLNLVRDTVFIQWDPVSIVAPSHALSIWSRIVDIELADLDRLIWE